MTTGGHTSDLKTVLVQGGPLEPRRAVDLLRRIAAAVDDAHANHRVHRGITTATILLAGDGSVYLADSSGATPSTDHTRALMVNTEAAYRADIYALAAVLYECLTGQPPNPILPGGAVPRASERRAGLTTAFDDVLARGLAANSDDRYRSAAELTDAAHRALVATPSSKSTIQAAAPAVPSDAATRTLQLPPDSATVNAPPRTPAHRPAMAMPHPHPVPLPAPPQPRRHRRIAPVIAAIAIIGVVVAGAIAIPRLVGHTRPSDHPTVTKGRSYTAKPIELPFPAFKDSKSVAVDKAGNVYVLAAPLQSGDTGVFDIAATNLYKLAAGATAATVVDFPGAEFRGASDITVDTAGNLYYSDGADVYVLEAGKSGPMRLPFRGFTTIRAIATDSSNNTYAVGSTSGVGLRLEYKAAKLRFGDSRPVDLPFRGLRLPRGIAVDKTGTIYVSTSFENSGKGQLVKLAAGATASEPVAIPGVIEPNRIAIDSDGNVFVGDGFGKGFFMLPARGGIPVKVPLGANTNAVAVGPGDAVYVLTTAQSNRSGQFTRPGQALKLVPDH
ncbi:hypothetical protein [Mycobacterium vicinigordonae]|uniref:non-specific serine/threonine protein kinase n=1 Tax=Mycobacterium vicinigordonae TaxID=1719132 RepID=A0A7D6E2Z5_9MYCO|nr:hypothetical protein [Mycobacterium vicinigordonae]QLL09650.1 hypothetical protein H0P51_12735 [Mycobacterium vicinigordonae]